MKLTKRQIECLLLAADGKTKWEIGRILGISENTSKKHLRQVYCKLAAINQSQAIATAFRAGIIS
jgi:LuxR family transcriptional regulator, quorum-sensing system regulator BjaR1